MPTKDLPSISPETTAPPTPKPNRNKKRLHLALALIGLWIASDSFFIVQPSEMAGLRRMGSLITKQPIGSGLHFKLPLLDAADTIQVSLDRSVIDDMDVYTADNQKITISIGLTERIPPNAVFRLLYDTGRTGSFDIKGNISQVAKDRALRVFARHNTQNISEKREEIAHLMTKEIGSAVKEYFGIDVIDVQIINLQYSKEFVESNEKAVKQKNIALAAQYEVQKIKAEAEQAVARSKGEAEANRTKAEGEAAARIARAKGDADSRLLAAAAEAKAADLVNEATARGLHLKGQAYAQFPALVTIAAIEQLFSRWQGQVPSTMIGGVSGNLPTLLNLALPNLTAPSNSAPPQQ
ncbi:PHB domain-containing protein [Azospirillaceae bacterium]